MIKNEYDYFIIYSDAFNTNVRQKWLETHFYEFMLFNKIVFKNTLTNTKNNSLKEQRYFVIWYNVWSPKNLIKFDLHSISALNV